MSWGTQRRNRILSIIFILIAVPVLLWIFVFNYEEPTCFDGKKNGGEGGVDCGGNCVLLCQSQAIAPYVKWERFFPVAPGVYNAMAYVENRNINAGTVLEYKFTLYDKEGAILAEKNGTTKLYAKETIPVAVNSMMVGKLSPVKVSFEITNILSWAVDKQRDNKIVILEEKQFSEINQTTVTAKIMNVGIEKIIKATVYTILYDRDDNAIGVSSTYVEKIDPNESKDIYFTWPKDYAGESVRFEVIPVYESN